MDAVPHLSVSNVVQGQCTVCIKSKTKRSSIQQPLCQHTRPVKLKHTDMSGKANTLSIGNSHHFVVFLDDCIAMSSVYSISRKLRFMKDLITCNSFSENKSLQHMYSLRLDNAGEQVGDEFCHFLNQNGLIKEFLPPFASQPNGPSKKLVQELQKMTILVLLDSRLSEIFGPKLSPTTTFYALDFYLQE